ncbi:MAG TPA: hypothetical protein VGQ94_00620, partial [Terriglobales bacterium]|nr:hypothetical protein [Terriglobales bacterium]
NGAGEEELLANIEGALGAPDDWSSNGKHLLFEVLGKETQRDIWLLRFDQDKKAAPLLKTPAAETQARLSPDGQWMAYVSNESGRDEVYVTPFPNVGPKWQISSEGGDLPRWGRDGRELFFLRPDNTVMVAPITETGTNVEVGAVKTLFKLNSPPGIFGSFSLAPEGSRFLATTGTGGGAGASLTLVVNWTAELKKK